MEQDLSDYLRAHPRRGAFRPIPHYSALGDFVWYYSRPGRHLARTVDDLLTIYVAMDSQELVGCAVHGVRARRMVDEATQLGVLGTDEPVRVRLLLLFGAWRAQTPEQRRQYRAVAALVGDAALPREELAMAPVIPIAPAAAPAEEAAAGGPRG